MREPLRGHRIVITGASSGIGVATARRLARDGARLALMARSVDGLEAAAAAAAEEGSPATVFPVDVTDRAAIEGAMTAAADDLGGIDALVSCAAGMVYGAFNELTPEDFDRCHEITFGGPVNTVRAALPELERTGGTVVAVVSMASKVAMPLHSPYVAAKFALRGFLDCLRVELLNQRSSVDICMVHPAFIGTPFFDHATSADGTRPKPLRPTYRPEDVADVIAACVRRPRAEVHVGGTAVLLSAVAMLSRPLRELALATYGVAGQRRPDPAPVPGMLWEPSGTGEATGTVPGRRSLWTTFRLAAGVPFEALDRVPGISRVVRLAR